MNERKGDWMQTYTGRQFWPLDPRPEDFDPRDIAHALAMKCRYNGHCLSFYSVAQHSVHVADECERRWPDRPDLAWWGLLHDLEEAYLPDIPRPLKRMGTGILSECAELIMVAAAARFGLEGTSEPPEVKMADTAVLAAEALRLMSPHPVEWCLSEPPAPIFIVPEPPYRAEESFLRAWSRFEPAKAGPDWDKIDRMYKCGKYAEVEAMEAAIKAINAAPAGKRGMFEGKIGKQMMIRQGYVPATCTLPNELAGPLVWSGVNQGRDACAGCNEDRLVCHGRPKATAPGGEVKQ